MDLAKLSINGQLTMPIEIRRFLNIKAGDKVLFMRNKSGEVVVSNASSVTVDNGQGDVK